MENRISYDEFVVRSDAVLARVQSVCESCGRSPEQVRLMAVTKTHGAWAVEYAQRYGLSFVGENRVQEAAEKRSGLPGLSQGGIGWELIGSLQSNKAKLAAGLFERVQSVDRVKLARELNRYCAALGRKLPVLVQVNAGRDPAKHGAELEEAPALVECVLGCESLSLEGLMTIAPLSDDPDVASRCFDALRELRDSLSARFGVALPELSMGMSGDMEQAVRAGSTIIRIGTALYGAR